MQVLYIPSAYMNNGGVIVRGINDAQNSALAARVADVTEYVNEYGGSLVCLGQSRLVDAYGWLPVPLWFRAYDFWDVSTTPDLGSAFSASSTDENLDHCCWHGYFYGPPDWAGIYRVLAYQTGHCTVTNGPSTNCRASLLANINTVLTAEDCYNGIDDDGNGYIDKDDPACWRCGDGYIDNQPHNPYPESCDNGKVGCGPNENCVFGGTGCSPTCVVEPLSPPSPPPSPPPNPPPPPGCTSSVWKYSYDTTTYVYRGDNSGDACQNKDRGVCSECHGQCCADDGKCKSSSCKANQLGSNQESCTFNAGSPGHSSGRGCPVAGSSYHAFCDTSAYSKDSCASITSCLGRIR